ncbi:MAG: hypothetical protein Udaeo2_34440 [Candidatus Udaeobacter sp.]|nr:MAG: hypothetical protein Udaeo2_34440 [Candidatus Udaeobacter sp.]
MHSCVAIFSHRTLHFTLHAPREKPYIALGNLVTELNRLRAAVVIAFPSGWSALRYRILNRLSIRHSVISGFD